VETVKHLLEDVEAGKHWNPGEPSREAVEKLVNERKPNNVTYADWLIIDQLEIGRGEAEGRPRKKFTEVQAMLQALAQHKNALTAGD
jgi:ferredoxin--NADP+ reductase